MLTGVVACVENPVGGMPTRVKLRMPTSGAKVWSGRSSTFFHPPVRAVPLTVTLAARGFFGLIDTSTLSTSKIVCWAVVAAAPVGVGVTGAATGFGAATGGAGGVGCGAGVGTGAGGVATCAGAGVGNGAAAGSGFGAAGCARGGGGVGAVAGFDGVGWIGGGCVTPGASTPGLLGTGLKLSSSWSGIPSAKLGANCAITRVLMHAATAAIALTFIPPLRII